MTVMPNQCFHTSNQIAELKVVCGSSAVLHFAGRQLPAAIGRGGVRVDKREGDGGTPLGLFPLRRVFYRSDRLDAPRTSLPCQALIEEDGWCDDETHPDYNRPIHLPHPARHEKVWREDELYDIIGVLGYNDDPARAGCGSAIFLHVATPDLKPTAGCIALSLGDLCWVLEQGLEAILVTN